jgi:hypothetical protein
MNQGHRWVRSMKKTRGQKSRATVPLRNISKRKWDYDAELKGTHARDFIVCFLNFFWHHSIIDKAEAQSFTNFVKLSVKSLYIIGFLWIPRYRQKRTVSLRVFSENATFHSAYSPKTKNSTSSLNTLYIAKSAQFYSAFSPTTISLTPHFRRNANLTSLFHRKRSKRSENAQLRRKR